jgi:hypothetical protein
MSKLQPFTRDDLISQRDEYARAKMEEYINETVESIYSGARKMAIERSNHEFYYTVREQTFVDVIIISEVIRDKLKVLFPDFTIDIGNVNDGYNRSRYICVKW